jgi:endogenous inhibitor of DNA gyrase (YacG/DUF329 family)
VRPEKKEKKRRKEVRVCLYCGINTVKGDKAYCSDACHKYDLEYREWLKQEKK